MKKIILFLILMMLSVSIHSQGSPPNASLFYPDGSIIKNPTDYDSLHFAGDGYISQFFHVGTGLFTYGTNDYLGWGLMENYILWFVNSSHAIALDYSVPRFQISTQTYFDDGFGSLSTLPVYLGSGGDLKWTFTGGGLVGNTTGNVPYITTDSLVLANQYALLLGSDTATPKAYTDSTINHFKVSNSPTDDYILKIDITGSDTTLQYEADAGGSVTDATIYGCMYDSVVSQQTITIATAGTYYTWEDSIHAGELSYVGYVDTNAIGDYLLIDSAGKYLLVANFSLIGENDAVVECHPSINDVLSPDIGFQRVLSSAADIGAAGFVGISDLSVNDTIKVEFTSDTNADEVNIIYGNLSVYRLGASGAGGGDDVSIDGVDITDPDLISGPGIMQNTSGSDDTLRIDTTFFVDYLDTLTGPTFPLSDSATGAERATLADSAVTSADENVQDKVGAMTTGNTETGISVDYQDDDGTIDFVVDVGSSIETGDITNGTILFEDINQNSATSGQIPKWNGAAWAAADDDNDGGGGTGVFDSLWVGDSLNIFALAANFGFNNDTILGIYNDTVNDTSHVVFGGTAIIKGNGGDIIHDDTTYMMYPLNILYDTTLYDLNLVDQTGEARLLIQTLDSNTATTHARLDLVTRTASGGDPFISLAVGGATNWSLGVDNSDGDKFKILSEDGLGGTAALSITTADVVNAPTFTADTIGATGIESDRIWASQNLRTGSIYDNDGNTVGIGGDTSDSTYILGTIYRSHTPVGGNAVADSAFMTKNYIDNNDFFTFKDSLTIVYVADSSGDTSLSVLESTTYNYFMGDTNKVFSITTSSQYPYIDLFQVDGGGGTGDKVDIGSDTIVFSTLDISPYMVALRFEFEQMDLLGIDSTFTNILNVPDTFIMNGDLFTDLTGSNLILNSGALKVDTADAVADAETKPVTGNAVYDYLDPYLDSIAVAQEIEDSLNEYSLTSAISSTYETITNVGKIGDDTANYMTAYDTVAAWDNSGLDSTNFGDATIGIEDLDTTGLGVYISAQVDTQSMSIIFLDTVKVTYDFLVDRLPKAITAFKIIGVLQNGTSVVGSFYECDPDGDMSDVVILASDITFDGGPDSTVSFSNATLDAGDFLAWKTTSVSGDVDNLTVTIHYTE